ncbi:hypothetical protein LguiB_017434 [Lonicera macranthoides]
MMGSIALFSYSKQHSITLIPPPSGLLYPMNWSSAGNCGDQKLTGDHKGNLLVSISEKQPYLLFIAKRRLSISSEVGKKQIAAFQSEANGELVLELMFYSHCDLSGPRLPNIMGATSISLQDLQTPVNKSQWRDGLSWDPLLELWG